MEVEHGLGVEVLTLGVVNGLERRRVLGAELAAHLGSYRAHFSQRVRVEEGEAVTELAEGGGVGKLRGAAEREEATRDVTGFGVDSVGLDLGDFLRALHGLEVLVLEVGLHGVVNGDVDAAPAFEDFGREISADWINKGTGTEVDVAGRGFLPVVERRVLERLGGEERDILDEYGLGRAVTDGLVALVS